MKILVRCAASRAMGFGHLFRSLALSRELKDLGAQVTIAIADGREVAAMVEREGFAVVLGEQADPAAKGAWLEHLVRRMGADALVLDLADDTPVSAIDAIRASGVLVASIDDGSDRRRSADLVFYPAIPQVEEFDWRGFSGTRLAGGEWVVLRRAFAGPPVRAARDRPVVLVTMGGSDPAGMTLTVVRGLGAAAAAFDAAIVIGPGYGDRDRLETMLATFERPVTLLDQPADIRAVMLGADLAVASFGVTAYELAATATPAVYLCYTEDHARSAAGLAGRGAAVSLGVHRGDEDARIAATVDALLGDRDRREAMGTAGRALIDGKGAARVAERIIQEMNQRHHGGHRGT